MNRFKRFFAPPAFEGDEEKTRVARLLNAILVAVLLAALSALVVTPFLFKNLLLALFVINIVLLLVLVALLIMRRGHVRFAGGLFLTGLWTAYAVLMLLSGGTTSFFAIGHVVVCMIAALVLGGRAAIAFAGLSVGAGVVMLFLDAQNLLPPPSLDTSAGPGWLNLATSLATATAVLFLAVRSIDAALNRARRYAGQLEGVRESLEERVVARTRELQEFASELSSRSRQLEASNRDLEQARRRQEAINRDLQEASARARRRAVQLQAVAEVGRAIAQIRDLDQLLPQVTELIGQHFGFYHVGIFLVDEARRYAVLRAANSPGGQAMLARNHKLEVGGQGIVGLVTFSGQPHTALDVGADAVHFSNPDLPETRSEMALPLKFGGQIMGALDVQSVEPRAFEEQDVAVLSVLADQVAIAIENARLLQQSQLALAEAEETQRRFLQQTWQAFLERRSNLQVEYTLAGVPSALEIQLPTAKQAAAAGDPVAVSDLAERGGEDGAARAVLAVPIKLHEQTLGVIELQEADRPRAWTEDEVALAQTVADQMAQALESARLFEETQAHAHREALTRRITDRIRDALDVDAMLQTAIEELGQALGASQVLVHLQAGSTKEAQAMEVELKDE
jgi:GAF domain-containing protein